MGRGERKKGSKRIADFFAIPTGRRAANFSPCDFLSANLTLAVDIFGITTKTPSLRRRFSRISRII
jgi:hypothetical protein